MFFCLYHSYLSSCQQHYSSAWRIPSGTSVQISLLWTCSRNLSHYMLRVEQGRKWRWQLMTVYWEMSKVEVCPSWPRIQRKIFTIEQGRKWQQPLLAYWEKCQCKVEVQAVQLCPGWPRIWKKSFLRLLWNIISVSFIVSFKLFLISLDTPWHLNTAHPGDQYYAFELEQTWKKKFVGYDGAEILLEIEWNNCDGFYANGFWS